jgi:serine phosphatase RsbU (regulator of sigma subunit)
VLALLNEAILRERADDRFCTVAYATLHEEGDVARAVVACGGHPLPLVLRAEGTVEAVGSPGTLLGIHRTPELSDRAVTLGPGDALVLFTDGVADSPSRDGVLAPEELEYIVAGAAGLGAEAIAARIEGPLAATGDRGTRDDAALLVLRRSP